MLFNSTENVATTSGNHSASVSPTWTTSFTYQQETILNSLWLTAVLGTDILYGLIFTAIYRSREFGSGYLLMVNLGIAEMLFTAVVIPIRFIYSHFQHNDPSSPLDAVYLRLHGKLVAPSYMITALHILVIAFNRYVAVVHYSRYKIMFSGRRTRLVLAAIWFVGVTSASPYILGYACFSYKPLWFTAAMEQSPDCPASEFMFHANQVGASFVVVAGAFFYGSVIRMIRKVRTITAKKSQSTRRNEQALLAIQFLVVTAAFVASWTCSTISEWLIGNGDADAAANPYFVVVLTTSWVINFGINPVTYLALNVRLRRNIKLVLTGGQISIGPARTGASVISHITTKHRPITQVAPAPMQVNY